MLNSGEKMSCGPLMMDRRWKTNIEHAPNCPRCASSNTKFCYYNNYSLSQPRYFCKGCRRYWTKGGSLRNVPHGGGCRKNRRGKSVRAPPTGLDRVGMNYPSSQPSSSSDDSSSGGGIAGSDIDLAVVFSKFLNPNSCLDHGSNNVSNPDYDPVDQDVAIDSNLQEDFIMGMEFSGVHQPRGDQFVDPVFERRLNEMEMLLSDGISEDILWADPPSFPDVSWQDQEQQQVQGFDGVVDDHSMFHTNPLNENWGSFDIVSYGA
ncbi:hypothetical protein ACHQM5_016574 [Ranunculus cassubicifolius]